MGLSVQKVREQGAAVDFKATLDSKEYEAELNEWLSKRAKNVRLDGFRPGKAPLSIVKSRYMGDAVSSVVNSLIDRAIKDIAKEHKVHMAGQPSVTIEKADSSEGFECKIEVEKLPDIELQDFSKIACEELVVEISKSDSDEYMQNLLENHKAFEKTPKEGKAEWGDKVKVSLNEIKDAEEIKSQELVLTKEVEDENLKAFFDSIVGRVAGEEVEAELLKNSPMKFKVSIDAVFSPKKHKMDDDFAKEFDCDDLDTLRAKLVEVRQADNNKLTSLFHKRQILDELNNQYDFDLPKSAVDFEFEQIWKRLQDEIEESKRQGDFDEDINMEEVKAEYEKIAFRRVKLGLLVSEIAKVHKIEITNDDLQKAIINEAMKYPDQAKEIFEYYSKNRQALQNLSAPLIEDKVVSFVFEKAKKKQTKITAKELPSKLKGVLPGYEEDEAVNASEGKKKIKKNSEEGSSEDKSTPAKKATKTKGE